MHVGYIGLKFTGRVEGFQTQVLGFGFIIDSQGLH